MTEIDICLFDLDGTLIDSTELILESYRHTLLEHHGTVPPDEVWLAGLGTPLRAQFRVATDDLAEIERMVETYREFNFAHHDRMVRPFPGIPAAVSTLKAGGMTLGVVTSKARTGLHRGLSVCGLEHLFDVLISVDDVTRYKPDPEPVLKALESLNSDARRAVFVGDSPHDMAAGRAAGVLTAAALWGPFNRGHLEAYSPDYWLNSPAEITRFLNT